MSDTANLVIDDSNFHEHFFDIRRHKPQPGQVMAKYTAVAYLEDGQLKRDLIGLLLKPGKAEAAARVMRVLGGAVEGDSYKVPREMAADLAAGMTIDQVATKPYRFILEQFFWASRDVIPENDPHWYTIPLLNWGDMVDQIDWKAIANLNENELSDLSGESEKFPLENVGKTV
jgi:hypothetical protein